MTSSSRVTATGLLTILALLTGPRVSSQSGPPSIGGYQLQSEVRVTRTISQFTYTARLASGGAALAGATGRATSLSTHTVLVDDALTFGPAGAGASVVSSDSFSFRHDRAVPFDWANIRWTITPAAHQNTPPVANAGVAQPAATGTSVTLDGSGSTDVDGDVLTFQWSIADRPIGSHSEISNASAVMPTFRVDVPGTYLFRLVVRDPSGAASAPSTVAVSTVNSPPVANAGPDQSVAGGALAQLTGAGSTDADGDALSYAWQFVQIPSASAARLEDANTVSPTFFPDRRGTFVVRLTVFDPSGASSSDVLNVTTANTAPDANAGPDQSIALGTVIQLDGSASTDVDSDGLGYSWSFTSRPEGSVAALSASTAPSPTFVVDVAGLYTLQLIVSDGQGGSDIDTVTITTLNTRPVANAGPDQAVINGQAVTLDGSLSADADGNALTFSWALTARPSGSAATLSGATAPQATFVADVPGTFVAQLTVSDGTLTSDAETVAITTGNTVPVADAGADPPKGAAGARVDLSGQASRDADGNPLTHTWALLSRPDGSTVTLDALTGVTTSFTPDLGGDYIVQLIVNDRFASSQPDTVLVRVNRRPVADAGFDRPAATGVAATLSGGGSSDPDLDPLTFTWTLSAPPGSQAALSDRFSSAPSFVPDVPGTFTARLMVNDGLTESLPDDVVITVETMPRLGLAPASQMATTFSSVPIIVTMTPAAGPGDVAVTLTSSDPALVGVPATVTIPSRQTAASFDVTTGAIAGTATLTATASSTSSASATVDVALRAMAVGLDTASVGVSRTVPGTITLAQPAPAGGVTVAITSDSLAVSISPGTVIIAPGSSTGGFSVLGLGLGTANVVANAAGFSGASAAVTSTIAQSLGPTPFEVERAAIKTATLVLSTPAPPGGLTVTLSSDDPSRATVSPSVLVASGQSAVDVPVAGVAEGATVVHASGTGLQPASLAVTVTPPSPARIESSPANGEGAVAVTRETVLRFSRAIANPELITAQTLFAQFGGQLLQSRIHVAPDRKTVTLFYLQTLPASARIRVQFQTDGLLDQLGVALDGDRDGHAGGLAVIDFDTLTLTTLPGTAVAGRVFASQLGDSGVNTPLAGVVVSVDGLETTLRTTTDAMGNFRLEPSPVGEFFVHIDGRAATNGVPVGAYYPVVGKKWESKAAQVMTISDVFLPLIVPGTLQPVSQTQDTVITFPASVLAQDPRLAGVQITVPADSLYSDNGARGGMVGIAPVAPDRIPSPLPPGLNLPLVITVQTDGATNFDRPVPVCFPNLPDPATGQPLAAGARSALWSFNHDIGDWEIVGPMTVAADRALVCSDDGVGIRQPGWHGTQRGTSLQYTFNWYVKGVEYANCFSSDACNSAGWPLPGPIRHDSPSGAYETFGNGVAGATPQEAADNREAIAKAVAESASGIAVIGTAGGSLFGASILSGFNFLDVEEDFDHVAIAFADASAPGGIRIAELLIGDKGPLGSNSPGSRSLDALAGTSDRVTAVPVFLPAGISRDEFLARLKEETREGASYSFTATAMQSGPITTSKGNTCATGVSQVIRGSSLDPSFGIPTSKGYNLVTPKQVVDFFANRNRAGLDRAVPQATSLLLKAAALAGMRPTASTEIALVLLRAPRFFYRVDYSVEPGVLITLRGRSSSGRLTTILPPDADGYITIYEANNHAAAATPFTTGSSGTVRERPLRIAPLNTAGDPDEDSDGLSNLAESTIGTSPITSDTDGDGLNDAAEIENGTDPLGGNPVVVGILAAADTPGPALDVAARNDIAVVADSDRGISVLNVAAGLNPVIVAQVNTPGDAHAIAFEDRLVAVADGPAGLAIVDISDPPAARIVRQLDPSALGGRATAVAVAGGTAYVGLDTNRVATVDLATGAILETVALPSDPGALQDLAIERDALYVLTAGHLHAIPLQSPLEVSGSVSSPSSIGAGNRRLRLFAGGGVAYATHGNGYNTFSLANPGHPTLIAAGRTAQVGWKQIVVNGSGLGFAAVGPNSSDDGPHNVSLYDVSDPTQTDRFITEFETPGIAAAVSIYNGIGYVADSEAGLQVVNYLAFDRNGVPPTIALESNFSVSPAGGTAEEGQVMRLTANVADDVQVRNVEFFVNGASVARDGNFPFEHRFVAPLLGASPSFTIRACAFDTGGNRTCTTDITVTLVEDATPPRVLTLTPPHGSRHRQNTVMSVSAAFSETIDTATFSASTFLLFSAGPDGQTATSDDVPVGGGTVSYNAQSATAIMSFASPLPIAQYRAVIRAGVSDLSGNSLGADSAWTFAVRGEKRWVSGTSGSWHTASNWSDNELPQPGDFVVIDRPAAALTVTYNAETLSISTIQSNEALVIAGGSLSIESLGSLNGGLTISAGTLAGAGTITATTFTMTGGQLTGTGGLTVSGDSTISGGSIAQRTLQLGQTTRWMTAGSVVSLSNGARLINPVGGTLTVSSDAPIFSAGPAAAQVVNQGTLRQTADTTEFVVAFDNSGTVVVDAGMLDLRGGGDASGAFVGAAGTTLRWSSSAPYALDPSSSLDTAGDVVFDFGAVDVQGSFRAGAITVGQGSPTFSGPLQAIPSLTFVGFGAPVTFNTAASVDITSLTMPSGVIQGPAVVNIGALVLSGDGGFGPGGPVSVTGTTTWNGGSVAGRTLTLGPATSSVSPGGGRLSVGEGGLVVNPAGATWQIQTGTEVSVEGRGRLVNAGRLVKRGTGLFRFVCDFDNQGVTNLDEGQLWMRSGRSTGVFTGAAGTEYLWDHASSYTLEASSTLSTLSSIRLERARLVVRGSLDVATVSSENADLTFDGPGPRIANLAVLNGNVTFSLTTPGTIAALTLNGAVNPRSDLTVGALNWQGGGFNFDAPATVTVTGATSFDNVASSGASIGGQGGIVRLGTQTTVVDGAQLVMGGGTSLVNPPGGLLILAGGAGFSWNIGGSAQPTTLVNQGRLVKQGAATATMAPGIAFVNTGTADVQGGALTLASNAAGNGVFAGAAGTTLNFGSATLGSSSRVETAGAVTLSGNNTLDGFFTAGSVTFTGGTTRFNGSVGSLGSSLALANLARVDFNGAAVVLPPVTLEFGASLGGTAPITATALTWLDGGFHGGGPFVVTGTTTVGPNGPFGKELGRPLTLGSLTIWQGPVVGLRDGARIENPVGGVLRFETDARVIGFGTDLSVVNRGTMEFAGNARTVSLTGLSFLNEGTLVHRLGGLASFDRIGLSEPVTFGGTLDVRLMDGFIPASGDTFTLFAHPSRSGEFEAVLGNGETYIATYGPSTFTVRKP
jgi:hypothetical protein